MEVVVGAAIVRDGRVLAARRTRPSAAAGRWEFPGGKVEPGETPETALVREIDEELGCRIAHRFWLAARVPITQTLELTVAVVDLVAGEPVPHEHDRVVWLTLDELGDLDWLDADQPFVTELTAVLGRETRR